MRVLLAILCLVTCAQALDDKGDVMPIFKAKCYDCHSEEGAKVRGGLRLDDEDYFLKRFSKNEVVVPGDWDASFLFVTLVRRSMRRGQRFRGTKVAYPLEQLSKESQAKAEKPAAPSMMEMEGK